MKDRETQLAFIKARAEGKSYSIIAKELGIAKATCTSWEQTLRGEIEAMKSAQLEELYTAYGMKREARIRTLGETLQRIDKAIEGKPLDELPADKLLELKLKYSKELRAEYTEPVDVDTDNTLDGVLEQYDKLYRESKAGKYSPAEIKAQLAVLDAKRATLIQEEQERQKEVEDPVLEALDLGDNYTSGIIRRGAEA